MERRLSRTRRLSGRSALPSRPAHLPQNPSWSELVPISTFICPISGRLLSDPVVTCDGHSYEKKEILAWFATGSETSPLTGLRLETTIVTPNHALRNSIEQYMQRLKTQKVRRRRRPPSPLLRSTIAYLVAPRGSR